MSLYGASPSHCDPKKGEDSMGKTRKGKEEKKSAREIFGLKGSLSAEVPRLKTGKKKWKFRGSDSKERAEISAADRFCSRVDHRGVPTPRGEDHAMEIQNAVGRLTERNPGKEREPILLGCRQSNHHLTRSCWLIGQGKRERKNGRKDASLLIVQTWL